MRSLKKIFAVLLCAVIVLSMSSCASIYGAAQLFKNYTKSDSSAADETGTVSPGSSSAPEDIPLIPEYRRCNAEEFNEKCAAFSEYAEIGDYEKAIPLYDELYDELCYMDSMCTAITIDYYEDVTDSANESEMEYMDELLTDCYDRLQTACGKLTRSSAAEEFRAHLNDDDLFEELAEYKEMSEREKELYSQETELENEYCKAADKMTDYSFSYGGHTYRLGDFYDSDTTAFDNITSEEYYTILAGCMKAYNRDAGEIYLRLVAIRSEIAELNGYESYADFADEKLYGRDYTAEDLTPFERTVKSCGYEVGDYGSYMYYLMPESDFYSVDGLLGNTGKVLEGISDYSDSAFEYFRSERLYSIGDEENRYDGGFTTTFPYPGQTGFIFMKSDWSSYDIETLIHETGHFTEGYMNGCNILKTMSYDVAEIHSTGLEMLACSRYGSIFDSDGCSVITANVLLNARECIVSGCLYDEWQRYVYANPGSTLDEINGKFYELCLEYGYGEEEYCSYMWALVNHNFDSPMYYISYAVSAFASLQIWQKSLTDYDAAVKIWENVIDAGIYSDYSSTLESCGLGSMSDTGMAADVINITDYAIESISRPIIAEIYN